MQAAQPVSSPLGIALLAAAVYVVVKSPKKLQTLGRMAIAFVVTVLLFLVPGAILRMGDPHALGAIGGLVAMLVAVIAGWWHTRALKRASAGTSGQGPAKG
jgi:hypothetical protein